MKLSDRTLVALGDEAQRTLMFSQEALEKIAIAAYRIEPGQLSAPWSARFDLVELAPRVQNAISADATVMWEPASQRGSAQFSTLAPQTKHESLLPVAYWGGAVIGQGRLGGGRIAQVSGNFVSLHGIDEAIDAAAGAGSEPVGMARAQAQLEEIATRLSSAAGAPGSIGAELVKKWLDEKADGDIEALLANVSQVELPGGFRIRYESDAPAQDLPMALGLDAVIFAFDPTEISIADALRATHAAQEHIALSRKPSDGVAGVDRRVSTVAIWVVSSSLFDDDGWPGANPAERRDRASQWLQTMGIAMVLGSDP